jgi:hypothetical protein
MMACFGPEISADRVERNHRFLEEALELVQANGCTQDEAHQLVDYVYGRPQGEINQEVGGVMVTLAALCLANGINMHEGGETELARIWTKVEQIRAKQAAKPKHSPLPALSHQPTPVAANASAELSKFANDLAAKQEPLGVQISAEDLGGAYIRDEPSANASAEARLRPSDCANPMQCGWHHVPTEPEIGLWMCSQPDCGHMTKALSTHPHASDCDKQGTTKSEGAELPSEILDACSPPSGALSHSAPSDYKAASPHISEIIDEMAKRWIDGKWDKAFREDCERLSRVAANASAEVRLRQALLHIQHMDVYTRPGENLPHLVMKEIAEKALSQDAVEDDDCCGAVPPCVGCAPEQPHASDCAKSDGAIYAEISKRETPPEEQASLNAVIDEALMHWPHTSDCDKQGER